MGTPINTLDLHEEACTMMIGKVWKKYSSILRETKWALIGSFNVMQFFLYRSSLALESEEKRFEAIKYLGYLKSIVDNVIPKILDNSSKSNELRQFLFSEANSLESHDVLHTSLSLTLATKFLPTEGKNINKK